MNPIFDFDVSLEDRIQYINKCKEEELYVYLKQLTGMYEFSGVKTLQTYMESIVTKSTISSMLKIDCVRSLLSFQEYEELIHKTDDEEMKSIKEMSNEFIRKKNKERQVIAYKSLAYVCDNFDDKVPTPFKVSMIIELMANDEYYTTSLNCLMKIVENNDLDCKYRYKTIISLESADIKDKEKYLYYFLYSFACNKLNYYSYRILSIQNLLINCKLLTITEKEELCLILQNCSLNPENEYNIRADSADTLINNGINDDFKAMGQKIIKELGEQYGKVKILYDNAQNVHVSNIEKSASEILLFLKTIETEKTLEQTFDEIKAYCKSTNIGLSMERILLDKNLYNSMKLADILVKLWSFINNHKDKDEMIKRLLEELEEMSGTCSTGFFTRLVNTISGFEENLNIKISFEDQIVANFVGRLNKKVTEITHPSSPFFWEKKKDVLKLYLNKNDILKDEKLHTRINSIETSKIPDIIQDFADSVVMEMTECSKNWDKRLSFLLFFKTNFPILRNELWEEFKPFVNEADFDLFFRKALSSYEGDV